MVLTCNFGIDWNSKKLSVKWKQLVYFAGKVSRYLLGTALVLWIQVLAWKSSRFGVVWSQVEELCNPASSFRNSWCCVLHKISSVCLLSSSVVPVLCRTFVWPVAGEKHYLALWKMGYFHFIFSTAETLKSDFHKFKCDTETLQT